MERETDLTTFSSDPSQFSQSCESTDATFFLGSELGFVTATKCILESTNGDSDGRIVRMKVKEEVLKMNKIISPEKENSGKKPKGTTDQRYPQKDTLIFAEAKCQSGILQKINLGTTSSLFSKKYQREGYTSLS